jgi:hypothetical protein
MKKRGDWGFFSRCRKRRWRKGRQRKWTKDKEKGRWTKKRENGRKAQRGTRETRYEREEKSKSIILERSGIKKKRG